jgi:predicted TIM-barrel fold metal-dependent hydrolase
MKIKYPVISGDSHMDIIWLPEDLFVSEAPAKLKDRMPKVVEGQEGRRWVADGVTLGLVASTGLTGTFSDAYTPGLSHSLDRMEEMGFFSDAQQGRYRAASSELRIADQDADGIQAEVIYGILGVASGFSYDEGGISDPEILTTVYDIYNEWIANFCKRNPGRFAGLACISCYDPEVAARQLRQAAKLGLRGAELNPSSAIKPIYHKDWNVLWASAAECQMPISFHAIGLDYRQPEGMDSVDQEYKLISLGICCALFQLSGAEVLSSILLSGACDRYADFKFVLGECGVGWIPYLLSKLDQHYEDRLFNLNLSLKPSELWHRQGYTTFQDELLTPEIIQAVGEDNILWGSDYPHPDATWPDSQKVLQRTLGHLPEKKLRKIIYENTGSLYGLTQ